MKSFAQIGAAGYVAPRHMKAIKDTGNALVAACDPYDGVGVIDSYFPEAAFFTEYERFDRHVEKLKRRGKPVDYFSICSPNYLHDAHVRFALRYGAKAICEKPLVLNPWNLDALEEMESECDGEIYTVLQLRHHPLIQQLKKKFSGKKLSEKKEIELTYISSRGKWYYASWKGNELKSGGIATNIGIHFFDMLLWLFGDVEKSIVHHSSHDRAAGYLELKNARVKWFLSINSDTLPEREKKSGKRTFRNITIDGEELEFSTGFENLHSLSYREILSGNGYRIKDARPSIELVHQIRNQELAPDSKNTHPLAALPLTPHPFEAGRRKQ